VWRRLEQEALVERCTTDRGVRLEFAASDEVEDRLRELAGLERECCAFAEWSVERRHARVVLSVTAQGEGIASIQALLDSVRPE